MRSILIAIGTATCLGMCANYSMGAPEAAAEEAVVGKPEFTSAAAIAEVFMSTAMPVRKWMAERISTLGQRMLMPVPHISMPDGPVRTLMLAARKTV